MVTSPHFFSVVQTTPRGLLTSRRICSVSGCTDWPFTRISWDGATFSPVPAIFPSIVTLPASIRRSASRLEHRPHWAKYLLRRIWVDGCDGCSTRYPSTLRYAHGLLRALRSRNPTCHSHIVGYSSHFYAHVRAGSKPMRPLMSKLIWALMGF